MEEARERVAAEERVDTSPLKNTENEHLNRQNLITTAQTPTKVLTNK